MKCAATSYFSCFVRATENPARAGHDQEEGGAEGVVCCQSFEYSLTDRQLDSSVCNCICDSCVRQFRLEKIKSTPIDLRVKTVRLEFSSHFHYSLRIRLLSPTNNRPFAPSEHRTSPLISFGHVQIYDFRIPQPPPPTGVVEVLLPPLRRSLSLFFIVVFQLYEFLQNENRYAVHFIWVSFLFVRL